MKEIDLFKQSSQVIEMADNLIAEYKKFSKKYKLSADSYFENKLVEMGYDVADASTILINKDLLLSMFLNKFEIMEVDCDDIIIDVNLEIEEARKKYIDAVDKANASIQMAADANELMLSTKKLIELDYGTNTNDWDSNTVHELNETIKLYNKLVNQANEDTESVKLARAELARVRVKYQKNETDINDVNSEELIVENNVVLETS